MEELKPNRNIGCLYPDIMKRYFRLAANMRGFFRDIFITEGFRSFKRQELLYSYGRTDLSKKIVTRAMAGDSMHNYGLAFDVAFLGPDAFDESLPWADLARLGKSAGFEAGFDWLHQDKPHFQLTYGMTLTQIKTLYAHNGIKSVWAACDKIRGVEPGIEWEPMPLEIVNARPSIKSPS